MSKEIKEPIHNWDVNVHGPILFRTEGVPATPTILTWLVPKSLLKSSTYVDIDVHDIVDEPIRLQAVLYLDRKGPKVSITAKPGVLVPPNLESLFELQFFTSTTSLGEKAYLQASAGSAIKDSFRIFARFDKIVWNDGTKELEYIHPLPESEETEDEEDEEYDGFITDHYDPVTGECT